MIPQGDCAAVSDRSVAAKFFGVRHQLAEREPDAPYSLTRRETRSPMTARLHTGVLLVALAAGHGAGRIGCSPARTGKGGSGRQSQTRFQ